MFLIKYICDYMTDRCYPTSAISSFKTKWKTVVRDHLNAQQKYAFVEKRAILKDAGLELEYSDESRRISIEGNDLWISSVVPAWRRGWRGIIKNEIVADVVDSYFHFLSQYWHR